MGGKTGKSTKIDFRVSRNFPGSPKTWGSIIYLSGGIFRGIIYRVYMGMTGCFQGIFRGWYPTQWCGDYFTNHGIGSIPIKQAMESKKDCFFPDSIRVYHFLFKIGDGSIPYFIYSRDGYILHHPPPPPSSPGCQWQIKSIRGLGWDSCT